MSKPLDKPTKSGRFMVRLPVTLHEMLAHEAALEGVSLNQLVLCKLSLPLTEITAACKNRSGREEAKTEAAHPRAEKSPAKQGATK